jgi:hypothetical protein
MNWLLRLFGFGGEKGIVEQVSDTVERWNPGPVKEHEMNLEQLKAEDASQDSARKAPEASSHEGIFNRVVDGLNRLPRPLMAFWAIGELTGLLPQPTHLNTINPIVLNIIWSVVGFYFGIRTITQDLPKLIQALRS